MHSIRSSPPGPLGFLVSPVWSSKPPWFARGVCVAAVLLSVSVASHPAAAADSAQALDVRYASEIQPILRQYCLGCHSAEKQKGDLDLEQFKTLDDVVAKPKIWQGVVEQINLGEMPPKDKPQLPTGERDRLLGWVADGLQEAARARAGDPGPVVLRRLSNAEYTYTIRDLTGVDSLDPVREFPGDSASGEGFMNVGQSLVMSPSLLTKYLDAAKEVARHALLLPTGLGFSPSVSQRDWSAEKLAAIRAFYSKFSENGGGTSVNLQGIQFDTKDGGVLPLERYLAATILDRDALRSGARSFSDVAVTRDLNPRYLQTLWTVLESGDRSLVLDLVRAAWRDAAPGDAKALTALVTQWQQALWRFTTVGHIGKRDGPKAWQVPMTPLAAAREVRMKIPTSQTGSVAVVYLSVSDAGDGNENDFALWGNPRLVASGRPDLPLRQLREAVSSLGAYRGQVVRSAAACLEAAAEFSQAAVAPAIPELARKHGVEPTILAAWLECLGLGGGESRIDAHITQKMESAQGYDFIKGWTGADALSVLANSSDQAVRVPGNMKPHGIAVHPSPRHRVLIGWRSPITGALRVSGAVQHAHTECGNGVDWAVEVRRGNTRQRLAAGVSQGAKSIALGPFDGVAIGRGDVIALIVGPRDANHSCDLTAVDLTIREGEKEWDLGREVSPNILAGNPHADTHGNPAVWHFYSEPDKGTGSDPVFPSGSLLARWQSEPDPAGRRSLAGRIQELLASTSLPAATNPPDVSLKELLTSLNGPLIGQFLRADRRTSETRQPTGGSDGADWGLDPGLFGRHPAGGGVDGVDLCVRAPSVLEVRIPAELARGGELVATAALHRPTGDEGSVQMRMLAARPSGAPGLAAGTAREVGSKSTWSDGERPVLSDAPILVNDGSRARERLEQDFDRFRQVFPAALCYTKIVPVDEVVTLTLYHREDDALRRLMLTEQQTRELERLWAELHYVSHDALKLVDAYEQLWQFATQDADPSAFTPMRESIERRAAEFRQLLKDTEPLHLDAALQFARRAFRRTLSGTEQEDLRKLYQGFRTRDLPHDESIRLLLARILVSPSFLYRTERPGPGTLSSPVGSAELATRLSYFLWASTPDAELLGRAGADRLQDPLEIAAQARRMLKDPRIRRLAVEFACVWLHVHGFDQLGEKSERHFPSFAPLRGAMYEETIRFFTDLFQNDGSVMDILEADHSFMNAELAGHYGLTRVTFTNTWQRVEGLRREARGGILGQATVLARQSGASRTSPILRGNWVAEVLLGEKLPRPPKDVPQLPEDEAAETLTMRQLTEKHSSDPLCSGCHKRIDPYGYSLEEFDAIGRRRTQDLGGRPIDTRTQLMNGRELAGVEGLRSYLANDRRDAFLRQFSRKLLGYALAREVRLSDDALLVEMRKRLEARGYRASAAIEAIVTSRQFREIRGIEMAFED